MLVGPLEGGSPAFGGNLWAQRYANICNENSLLAAVETPHRGDACRSPTLSARGSYRSRLSTTEAVGQLNRRLSPGRRDVQAAEESGFTLVRSVVVPHFRFRKPATQHSAEAYGVKAVLFTATGPALA